MCRWRRVPSKQQCGGAEKVACLQNAKDHTMASIFCQTLLLTEFLPKKQPQSPNGQKLFYMPSTAKPKTPKIRSLSQVFAKNWIMQCAVLVKVYYIRFSRKMYPFAESSRLKNVTARLKKQLRNNENKSNFYYLSHSLTLLPFYEKQHNAWFLHKAQGQKGSTMKITYYWKSPTYMKIN